MCRTAPPSYGAGISLVLGTGHTYRTTRPPSRPSLAWNLPTVPRGGVCDRVAILPGGRNDRTIRAITSPQLPTRRGSKMASDSGTNRVHREHAAAHNEGAPKCQLKLQQRVVGQEGSLVVAASGTTRATRGCRIQPPNLNLPLAGLEHKHDDPWSSHEGPHNKSPASHTEAGLSHTCPPRGFEPPANSLGNCCSIQLSYGGQAPSYGLPCDECQRIQPGPALPRLMAATPASLRCR